jgi:hypothetical protein
VTVEVTSRGTSVEEQPPVQAGAMNLLDRWTPEPPVGLPEARRPRPSGRAATETLDSQDRWEDPLDRAAERHRRHASGADPSAPARSPTAAFEARS